MSKYSIEYKFGDVGNGERHCIYVKSEDVVVCKFFGEDEAMVWLNLYAGLHLLESAEVIGDAKSLYEKFEKEWSQ